MIKKDKSLVLYIVETNDNAQFRYQVKNVEEVVKNSKNYEVIWFLKSEIAEAKKYLNRISLVVVGRQTAKDDVVLDFIEEVQKKGKKVIFDLDDLVFDYKDLSVLMGSINSKNVFYWIGYFWGIRRIAKRVDGFLCTNGFLGEKLKKSFNKPYEVVSNSLNKEQVSDSEELIKKKKFGGGFLIGYFSGSPTHKKDFGMIEAELIKFLNDHDEAILRVVGYMNFSDEMKVLIKKGRVQVVKFINYLKLQELISEVDVNIAPLVINDFTNCKSELKFFEAGVVETTTIASPTYTFKKAIKDGENGFLAQPGEWYDKLEYLYKHPEENKKIAKNAREYALKHYYGKEFLKEVEKAYDYFAK